MPTSTRITTKTELTTGTTHLYGQSPDDTVIRFPLQISTSANTPEGDIDGSSGAIHIVKDATELFNLYIKGSGTADTGWRVIPPLGSGITGDRPTLTTAHAGYTWYDTTISALIAWTGSAWIVLARKLYGTTGSRPTGLAATDTGLMYFDTTLSKPIWYSGGGTLWFDATGASV